jgi:hypothetical protein
VAYAVGNGFRGEGHESPLRGWEVFGDGCYGVAIGWYETAPLALRWPHSVSGCQSIAHKLERTGTKSFSFAPGGAWRILRGDYPGMNRWAAIFDRPPDLGWKARRGGMEIPFIPGALGTARPTGGRGSAPSPTSWANGPIFLPIRHFIRRSLGEGGRAKRDGGSPAQRAGWTFPTNPCAPTGRDTFQCQTNCRVVIAALQAARDIGSQTQGVALG